MNAHFLISVVICGVQEAIYINSVTVMFYTEESG